MSLLTEILSQVGIHSTDFVILVCCILWCCY